MKTITKAQYLYLKSKKNAKRFKNELVELTDEEYEDLIQYAPNITPEPENEEIHTITFKDGDDIVKIITGPMGTYISVPNVEKEGYEFLGWSLDGKKVTMPVDGIYDSDITYIAVWEKI